MTTCTTCGAIFADGAKFCEVCGAQLPVSEVQNVNVNVDTAQAQNENFAEVGSEQPKRKKKKGLKIGLIIAIPILALLVGAYFFFGCNKINGIIYWQDEDLFYGDLSGFKFNPLEIDSEDEDFVFLSNDGKKIFYAVMDKDGEKADIYYRYTNKPDKEGIKLISNVTDDEVAYFEINKAGTLITYIKDGALYQHDFEQATKIEKDVQMFWTSENGKKIIYADNEGDLYLKNGKKDAKKIKGGVSSVEYVSSDLSEMYFKTEDDDLYLKKGNKDVKKIASDVYTVNCVYESGEIYYTTREETEEKQSNGSSSKNVTKTLFYYDGENKKKIVEDYYFCDSSEDKAILVYCTTDEGSDGKTVRNFYLVIGGKEIEIDVDDISFADLSYDGKTLLFKTDEDDEGYGTVYTAKISKNKMESPKEYDSDVHMAYFVGKGDDIICGKDVEEKNPDSWGTGYDFEYSLYMNKKHVADNVYSYSWYYELKNSELLLFYVDVDMTECTGTLMAYNGRKTVELGSDVEFGIGKGFTITYKGDVAFIRDWDSDKDEGELCSYNGITVKKLADDVSSVQAAQNFYKYIRTLKYERCITIDISNSESEEK